MTPGSSFFLLFFESEPLSLSGGVSRAVVRAEGRGWGQGGEGVAAREGGWRVLIEALYKGYILSGALLRPSQPPVREAF